MRTTAAAWNSLYNLRSEGLAAWMDEHDAAVAALEEATQSLMTRLFFEVPRAPTSLMRRALIRAKRAVFREQPLDVLEIEGVPGISDLTEAYRRALTRLAAVERRAEEFIDELLARIDQIADDDLFGVACRFASPDLWEDLQHRRGRMSNRITSLDRGIASYATKLLTKANPQHVFTRTGFPTGAGIEVGDECEVVLGLATMTALEADVLADATDPCRTWLCVRPHRQSGETYEFWLSDDTPLRVLRCGASPTLDAVLGFFRDRAIESGRPAATEAEWLDYAQTRLRWARRDAATVIATLVPEGIVKRYLITDVDRLGPALCGLSSRHERRVAVAASCHLVHVPRSRLPALERELAAAWADGTGPRSTLEYFVNSYSSDLSSSHLTAAQDVAESLRDLRPCFSVEHNFSRRERAIRRLMVECCSEAHRPIVEYCDLLRYVCSRWSTDASGTPPADEEEPLRQWRRAAAAETGVLSPDRLRALSAWARSLADPRPLCFRGPFDYAARRFYVANVLDGNGRFAGRYALHRRPTPGSATEDSEPIDVELVAPAPKNLNYVASTYETGCGFEARWAHRFRAWLQPTDIAIEAHDRGVIYRRTSTGQRVRFHYRGFLLAGQLPLEYQLLLVGSGDTFVNPFEGAVTAGPADVVVRDEASYGPVCLRRKRWEVGRRLLEPLASCSVEWRFSLELRRWLRATLHEATTLWYYRAFRARRRDSKPRLLDLENLMTAVEFRRVLAGGPETIVFTAMAPTPEHFWMDSDGPHYTELMIEV